MRLGEENSLELDKRTLSLEEVIIEHPRVEDGQQVWQLARRIARLDVNAPSFYDLWCRDFAHTSAVARTSDNVIGYIIGYERPREVGTLFMAQTAVSPSYGISGLTCQMLDWLVGSSYRYVEATATASNKWLEHNLCAFANKRSSRLLATPYFDKGMFPTRRETEMLYRIGPLGTLVHWPIGQCGLNCNTGAAATCVSTVSVPL